VNTIAAHLEVEDIRLDVDVANKEQLFFEISRDMAQKYGLQETLVAAGLSRREKICSTGLGEGVAIPHARVKDLERIRVAYLRLKTPIPFDAPDGKPVRDILVLLVPQQATEEHLQVLADATQYLADRMIREQLHRCTLAAEVKQLFASRLCSL
jgi:PTS system nitrogen regulatory IIA component